MFLSILYTYIKKAFPMSVASSSKLRKAICYVEELKKDERRRAIAIETIDELLV